MNPRSMLRRAALSLLLLAGPKALAQASDVGAEKCRVVAQWAAMVSMYCPADTDVTALAAKLATLKTQYLHPKMRQVHFIVVQEEAKAPKSGKDLNMSEPVYDRVVFATADWNQNTGFKEYRCKRKPKKQLGACTELLP